VKLVVYVAMSGKYIAEDVAVQQQQPVQTAGWH